ncbi:MAG TPA: hypothetical protein VLW47_04055 [Thermodesulfobacteriota bacterium]|jgi:predicted patatin/cPLA2 family phospholipase|nr:hypothetical protein [Thermodesulfobacteriota bacterium]
MKVGIACSGGGPKGVFVHGVLASFAEAGLKADIYGAASSTTIVAAFAAIGQLGMLQGSTYWKERHARFVRNNYDMSKTILESISEVIATLSVKLFKSDSAAYAVAVSAIITREAQELSQGPQARRLGKQLIISTRKRDKSWAEKNLELRLFETGSEDVQFRLTPQNLAEVLYATTRMLHAWKTPAWIEGFPYVDASYLCECPAVELAQRGCDNVIAISPEAGQVYRDFFQAEKLPSSCGKIPILIVQPLLNLAEMGVDYMNVAEDGLEKAYELGLRAGTEFLQSEKAKEL